MPRPELASEQKRTLIITARTASIWREPIFGPHGQEQNTGFVRDGAASSFLPFSFWSLILLSCFSRLRQVCCRSRARLSLLLQPLHPHPSIPMASDVEAATALKAQGNKAFAQHDWPTAVDFYSQAIEKYDQEPSFFCNRAQVRFATRLSMCGEGGLGRVSTRWVAEIRPYWN